jgi:hypothetical protein
VRRTPSARVRSDVITFTTGAALECHDGSLHHETKPNGSMVEINQ